MFKVKLSRAIDCADSVVVHGFDIDEFNVEDHDVDHLVLGCSAVWEFKLPNCEVEVDEAGSCFVRGLQREHGPEEWEPFEGFVTFKVARPLTEEDCN